MSKHASGKMSKTKDPTLLYFTKQNTNLVKYKDSEATFFDPLDTVQDKVGFIPKFKDIISCLDTTEFGKEWESPVLGNSRASLKNIVIHIYLGYTRQHVCQIYHLQSIFLNHAKYSCRTGLRFALRGAGLK
jgi:hypothetical protein